MTPPLQQQQQQTLAKYTSGYLETLGSPLASGLIRIGKIKQKM
jgi:hypothetical protein